MYCPIEDVQDIVWVREGRLDDQIRHSIVQNDGALFLEAVTKNNSGVYSCLPQNTVDQDLMKSIKVIVRSTLVNFKSITLESLVKYVLSILTDIEFFI